MDINNLTINPIEALNTAVVIITFIVTIRINKRTTRTQNKVNDLNTILNTEFEIKKETSMISLDRSKVAFEYMNELIEKMKKINADTFDEINRTIKIDSYNIFWKNIIYYPKDIADLILKVNKLAMTAIDTYRINDEEYWKILNTINEEYFKFISIFRRRYYFDTIDLSELMNKKIEAVGH